MKIPPSFKKKYTKTNYRIVGPHSHAAIKPCYWMEQRLLTGRDNRNCYKGYFGVQSHLCLQNTPALPFCPHNCVFCWRDIEQGTLAPTFATDPDPPGVLIAEMIRHQVNLLDYHLTLERSLDHYAAVRAVLGCLLTAREPLTEEAIARAVNQSKGAVAKAIITLKNTDLAVGVPPALTHYELHPALHGRGFTRGDGDDLLREHVTTPAEIEQCHAEAHHPAHAAISLGGEPTVYPHIGEFVQKFRARGFTTFIVTNGVFPEIIEGWRRAEFPTQLYVSLPAFSADSYRKICRSTFPDGWARLGRTLDMMRDLPTRTVLRLTVIKGLNDRAYDEYARLIARAAPDFVDLKGFTTEAFALEIGRRLGHPGADAHDYFPEMDDIERLAAALVERTDATIAARVPRSRDLLLRVEWPADRSLLLEVP